MYVQIYYCYKKVKKKKKNSLTHSGRGWGSSQQGPGLLALLYTSRRGDGAERSDMCWRGRKYHTSAPTSAADGLFAACERCESECVVHLKRVIYVNNKGGCERGPKRRAPRQLAHRVRRSHAADWVKTSQRMIDDRRCLSHQHGFICRGPVCWDFYLFKRPIGAGVTSWLFNSTAVLPGVAFKFPPAINYEQVWIRSI